MSSFRMVIAGAALALAGGALGGGCGGGSNFDLTTQAGFCQALATADCSDAAVRACYGADDSSVDADTKLCVSVRSSPEICNPQGLPYDATYAQDCIDAHTNLYQSAMLDPGLLATMTQACEGVFNKGGMQGTMCTTDTDCAVIPAVEQMAGYACVIHAGKGTCQIPNPATPGGPCADPADQCPDGFSCQTVGTSADCVANPGLGAACGPGVTCGSSMNPLRCDAMAKTCAAPLGDGSPCTVPTDCAGGFCILTANGGLCSHTYTLAFGASTCSGFTAK